MVSFGPIDPYSDPFRPPSTATRVFCLHCDEEFDSDALQWRAFRDEDGEANGVWICPTPGCDGKGFGIDIMPVDPDYQDERGGWICFSDDEIDDA